MTITAYEVRDGWFYFQTRSGEPWHDKIGKWNNWLSDMFCIQGIDVGHHKCSDGDVNRSLLPRGI